MASGNSMRSLLAKKASNQPIYNGLIGDNYHIYSSGINTINIEFDKISPDLEFTYKIGTKTISKKVDKRVYSLYYDYNSDIEFTVKTLSDEKQIILGYKDLQKTVSISGGKYYFIKDGNLYENQKLLLKKVNHIYNNLAITNDNKIYGEYLTYDDRAIKEYNIALEEAKKRANKPELEEVPRLELKKKTFYN